MSVAQCPVCPHACSLAQDERGVCGARRAKDGVVIPLNYGRCTSLALDPIEKKPLSHFYPGSTIYSYGSFGCNLSCSFCQNSEISQVRMRDGTGETEGETEGDGSSVSPGYVRQMETEGDGSSVLRTPARQMNRPLLSPLLSHQQVSPTNRPPGRRWDTRTIHEGHPAFTPVPTRYLSPAELVQQAVALKPQGNIGVALTYNEPLISPEYLLDVAKETQIEGLKLAVVTNGYVTLQTAEQVFKAADAANIDLKAFNQDFYTSVGAPAGLATVKQSIQIALAQGCHVEITTLIIPGLNDSPDEMAEEATWIASLSPEIPFHVSRFRPSYHMMDRPPTPVDTMHTLANIAREHLNFVYIGNM